MLRETQFKTSEVGANIESRLKPPTTVQVILLKLLIGGVHSLQYTLAEYERLLQHSVPDASFLILPTFTTRGEIPTYNPEGGQ